MRERGTWSWNGAPGARTAVAVPAFVAACALVAGCKGKGPAERATRPESRVWSFDDTPGVETPPGLAFATGAWRLEPAGDAPSGPFVLAQTARSDGSVFNVVLIEGAEARDLDLSVRLRAREGFVDQGGGLVWRARDARNYYIARYNPLEANTRVYVVQDGMRRQLESADTHVEPLAWHTLRVRMVGDRIECFLDGRRLLEARDATFPEAGRVGVWTKADARTHFDDLALSAP